MARFWFGLVLLLAACASPRIGEVGPALCKGGEDEDHDGLIDCADPDCQNLDQCRDFVIAHDGGVSDAGRSDGGRMIGPPLRLDSGTVDTPGMDGGMSSMPDDDDGGGPIPIIDAGPPATCTPECKATEECIDLKCKPATSSTSQTIAVTILRARGASDLFSACLDGDCAQPTFALCCPIDPYVQVTQVHADGSPDTLIGRTETAHDDSTPSYGMPTWNVDLAEGDLLQFEMMDDNSDVDDTSVFECKPVLTNLKSGEQTCTSFVGAYIVSITAKLEPKK